MSSFAALLASVGKDGQSANAPPPKSPASATHAAKPKPTMVANGTKPVASAGTPTLKRKAEDGDAGARPKTVRTESNPAISRASNIPTTSTMKPTPGASGGYKGNARPAAATANSIKPRPVQNAAANSAVGSTSGPASTTASAPAPAAKKGGFAATLARAAAAQEASKATGGNNIVHKPVEKLSRRERERRQLQEAAEKQKQKMQPGKGKITQQTGRSRSGTSGDGKAGPQVKKAPVQVGYSGTMRKPAEVAYQGTMRAKDPAKPVQPAKQKDKFGGQDRYGGYASWSDLSGAEDDEDDGYGSESDDMEGGFDELEQEEAATARLARKEDQEAQAEEDRLKKEKLERKKRLEAMAKQQAGKKRF